MCTNYRPSSRDLVREMMALGTLPDDLVWKPETWKDYAAPFVRKSDAGRQLLLGTYGMVPRKRIPPDVKVFDTMNARFETVGEKRSFSGAWKRSQHCLIPMTAFYEPCYESGKAVRWGIGMADESMFAVAGLWREWEAEGSLEYSFTQLTINADDHRLMKRFHKPGDEKRALVIVPRNEWCDWLSCEDPEYARSFMRPFPAELMTSWEFPIPPRIKKTDTEVHA